MRLAIAISSHCDIIAVRAEIAVVLVQGLDGGDVRRVFDNLVNPLDSLHNFHTLLHRENGRSFMKGNFLIRVNSDNQLRP